MTTSKMLKFERLLKTKRCPSCGRRRMIPRRPRDYRRARCCNCGAMTKMKENA